MNKRLLLCSFMLIQFVATLFAQEILNGFVIKPDDNCPFTIRSGFGEYGFVLINTTLSDLRFDISAAPKRLVASDYNMEKQQWILKIIPNDNNYKKYRITINSKGFKQGEIEISVKQKESICFDIDPLHEPKKTNVKELPHVDVSYYEKGEWGNDRLFARVNGIEYKIDIPNESDAPDDLNYIKCFSVAEQEDFDGNGIIDALIEETEGCGNMGLLVYYIVSYTEDGYFSVSNSVWGNGYSIEDWKGKTTILVFDNNVGYGNDKLGIKKERYVLKEGQLELVETATKQLIISEKELKSSDFQHKEERPLRLAYDLDVYKTEHIHPV